MSADTYDCELCGALVFTDHRAHHEKNLCPVLQQRLRTKAKARMQQRHARRPNAKPVKCALEECDTMFTPDGVHHRFCCTQHADRARWGEDMDRAEDARHAAEMAPHLADLERCRVAAEAVPILVGRASHRLWGKCLGIEHLVGMYE